MKKKIELLKALKTFQKALSEIRNLTDNLALLNRECERSFDEMNEHLNEIDAKIYEATQLLLKKKKGVANG